MKLDTKPRLLVAYDVWEKSKVRALKRGSKMEKYKRD